MRVEYQVRQRGEPDDEADRQPQVAMDLRPRFGEVHFAELRFERRRELQARKAAPQLQSVWGLRRSESGPRGRLAHADIRQAGDARAPARAHVIPDAGAGPGHP